jgi:hypothetical protein
MTLRPKGQLSGQPNQRFFSWVEKEALKDNMKNSERGGELVGVIVIGLIALFLFTPNRSNRLFYIFI